MFPVIPTADVFTTIHSGFRDIFLSSACSHAVVADSFARSIAFFLLVVSAALGNPFF